MARKAFQTPDEHAAQIDQLVRNTVISIARDVEKGHFGGMTEDRIVEEVYRKYAGLLMTADPSNEPSRSTRSSTPTP